MRNNPQSISDPRSSIAKAGRRALEMILAMYQSAATGLPVKLPLKDVASTDFTGRFSR
jgi:UDP-N-acetyl-2-amino-2-deoxyglucuronate dehydrogenase